MSEIRIAIAGIGNCASSLIQGINYYSELEANHADNKLGLMHYELGKYKPDNIRIVAAFDIDERKVGKPIHRAVFAKPNCTKTFNGGLPDYPVIVEMGEVLDGVAQHMENYPEDKRFIIAKKTAVVLTNTILGSFCAITYIW